MSRTAIQVAIGLAVLSVLLVGVGIATIGASAAAAQEDAGNESDASGPSSVVAEVDQQVRVSSYSYDDGNETLAISLDHVDPEGDRSTITITEMISGKDADSGSFGVERLRLRPGEETTIEVSAARVDGTVGAMIVSERSLERGTGAFVRDSEDAGPTTITGEPTWGTVQVGGAVGILGTLSVVLVASWSHISEEHDDVEEVRV